MDAETLQELLSLDGLRLLKEIGPFDSAADVVRTVAELRRAGHSPARVAAVLSQSKLRARGHAKFGEFAERMLFTAAGLEQATRLPVAAMHAGRFQRAGIDQVFDLGCGIGADAMALAELGIAVTAVDRDEVTAAVAAYNLTPWPSATVITTDATTVDVGAAGGIFLDPARREGARRLVDAADWSPSLDFAFGQGDRLPTGVKLGPGIDRALIPPGAEAQWISVDHDVVEVGVWFGAVAREGITRAALVIGAHGDAELTAAADSDDAEVGELGEYLFEPDGAVIRARLIGDLAREIDGRMLSHAIAYVTADAPAVTPFASCFRIIDELPADERKLKRALQSRKIGTLEIKKRGIDIDPSTLRTRLALNGDAAATLILTRIGDRRVALLAERVR